MLLCNRLSLTVFVLPCLIARCPERSEQTVLSPGANTNESHSGSTTRRPFIITFMSFAISTVSPFVFVNIASILSSTHFNSESISADASTISSITSASSAASSCISATLHPIIRSAVVKTQNKTK